MKHHGNHHGNHYGSHYHRQVSHRLNAQKLDPLPVYAPFAVLTLWIIYIAAVLIMGAVGLAGAS